MSELHLEPCPHCGCSHVKVVNWNGSTLTAAQCRACGARGPVRPIMADNDIEAVHALVADDWNIRFPLGETQAILDRVDTEEAESPAEFHAGPAFSSKEEAERYARQLLAQSHEDQDPDNSDAVVDSPNTTQGEAINQGNRSLPAPSPTQEALTPGDGGGKGTQPNISPTPDPSAAPAASQPVDPKGDDRKSSNGGGDGKSTPLVAVVIGSRLRRYLKDVNEKTPQGAIKRGHDLGVSWCTAQKIMDGKRVSDQSLETLSNALDRLEKPNKEAADLSEFQDSVTERLQAFMDRRQLNADLGSKMYAPLLLTSESVLYDILTMKAWPSNATLRDIDMALEKLERREETETPEGEKKGDKGFQRLGGYDESKVQVLPNELPPIKQLNPLPTYTPPARCSRET